MTSILFAAALISTLHLEADVPRAGGDYLVVEFDVPPGTAEMEISHSDGSDVNILDFGVWSPDGFRGWGGGLTENTIIGVQASSRGYLTGPITPGRWQLVIGKAQINQDPAHYTSDITFRDAPTLPPQVLASWTPVVLEAGPRWYQGDFHVHSRESGDAQATFDQIRDLARNRGLDFVVLSDHNTISQHPLIAAYQNGVSDLLFVRGNEVTTYGGHGNALGSTDYVDHRVGLGGRTAQDIVDDVAAQNALFIINHPKLDLNGACIGCAWTHADTPWDKVAGLEIANGNWVYELVLFTLPAIMLWDQELDAGHAIAPLGGSDDHTAGMNEGQAGSPIGSPTTRVYAVELSEPAIVQAVREGRTVVAFSGPDDPQVELFLVDRDGQRAMIGDSVMGQAIQAEIHVVGGRGYSAQLVKNGTPGDYLAVDEDDWTMRVPLEVSPAGDRVRVHLVDPDDKLRVVTGHVWATFHPDPVDDGGPASDAASDGAAGDLGSGSDAASDGGAMADTARDAAGDRRSGNASDDSGGGCSTLSGPAHGSAAHLGPAHRNPAHGGVAHGGLVLLVLLVAVVLVGRQRASSAAI